MNDFPKALEYYNRALTAREKPQNSDQDKIGIASTCEKIAAVYYKQNDGVHAVDYLTRALDIREQIQGNTHDNTAQTCQSLAGAYSKMGEYTKALEYYQRALEIREPILGTSHKDIINLKNNIHVTEYQVARLKGKLKSFFNDHCFIGTVATGDNPATRQGLEGEYVLLEFADWNQFSEQSLFEKADELRQYPKDIVVMKDGIISTHHFDNKLGIAFGVKQITKDVKQQINKAYIEWKNRSNP